MRADLAGPSVGLASWAGVGGSWGASSSVVGSGTSGEAAASSGKSAHGWSNVSSQHCSSVLASAAVVC